MADVRPWLVIVIEHEIHTDKEHKEQVLFFNDYQEAVDWTSAYPELTCVVGTAVAIFGPNNGVGKPFDGMTPSKGYAG